MIGLDVHVLGLTSISTGGSSGVGREVCKELALMGADVYTGRCRGGGGGGAR